MLEILTSCYSSSSFDLKFFVYGYLRNEEVKEKQLGNCILKPFSEDQFMLDLASARAIISGGSFTVLTESLALRKPILSLPIKGQFEQEMNAFYLEKAGYGKNCKSITKKVIEDFFKSP